MHTGVSSRNIREDDCQDYLDWTSTTLACVAAELNPGIAIPGFSSAVTQATTTLDFLKVVRFLFPVWQ